MKKVFLIGIGVLSFFAVWHFPLTAQTADAPAKAPATPGISQEKTLSSPPVVGISSVQTNQAVSPGLTPFARPGEVSAAPQEETIPVKVEDPKARKKVKVVAEKEKKKEVKTDKKAWKAKIKESKKERALAKASEKAMQEALEQQVKAARVERSTRMPYLDKIYIQSEITPLEIQRKEVFLQGGPKNLQDLVERAKSVSTTARADYENIALWNRRLLLAFRKLFPDVSFNMNDREGRLSGYPGLPEPYTGADWHITLKQPLFNGGILWNTFLQEKANLEAAKKNFDKTIAELIYELSTVYFEYQRTLQIVEENRITVEKMKRYADMSASKYQQKLISEMEHLNVQSLYSQMQLDLEQASQDFEIARLKLQKHLDLSPNDDLALVKNYDLNAILQAGQSVPEGQPLADLSQMMPGIFKEDEKAPELSQMIDLSYGNRPELRVEAAKLQAARLQEKVRWGEFLPKAYLTYEAGQSGEADQKGPFSDAVHGGTPLYSNKPVLKNDWRFLIEMSWNVGGNKMGYTYDRNQRAPSLTQYESATGTQLRANGFTVGVLDGLDVFVATKQAEVDKLKQVVQLEDAEKKVIQDVKEAYYNYQKSLIQVRSTVKRLEYRKRLRDFTEHKLLSRREGTEISELMGAESDLVHTKGELHKALNEYFAAKAALNHAVGIQNFLGIEEPQKK